MNNTTQVNGTIIVQPSGIGELELYGVLSMLACFTFLYVNGVMLVTLRSKPVFRDTPRYILLYNLVFADTFQLALSLLMYILGASRVYMVRYVCGMFNMFAIVTANISPFNLAVMSLERYVAVCFPLRHTTIVTIRGTGVAIAVVWTICSANTLIRFVILIILDPSTADQYMADFCSKENFFRLGIFQEFDKAFTCIVFVSVGVVIFFSYIGVMVAARSASSDKASITKARKTVLLHLIQLCLSLSSTLSSPIITAIARTGVDRQTFLRLQIVIFIILILLHRCLMPLIYGLRDQTIRPVLLYHLSCHIRHTARISVTHTK